MSRLVKKKKKNKIICAPSEDSDQPRHPPSLIRVFAVRSLRSWGPNISSWGQRRLWSGGCPGWSESSLGVQVSLLVLSWCGSNDISFEGVRDVATAIITHEHTRSNHVYGFHTLDAVFPKNLFSGYFGNIYVSVNTDKDFRNLFPQTPIGCFAKNYPLFSKARALLVRYIMFVFFLFCFVVVVVVFFVFFCFLLLFFVCLFFVFLLLLLFFSSNKRTKVSLHASSCGFIIIDF